MSYSSEVLADSPLAYYRLGEASGSTMVDSSGNGKNGAYVGGPTLGVAGLVGDADTAMQAATGKYAQTTYDSWLLRSAFTIEAWVKPSSLSGSNWPIVARHGSSGFTWDVLVNGANVSFRTELSGGVTASGALTAGQAAHVVCRRSADTNSIFINGVLITSASSSLSSSGANFSIGALDSAYASLYFDGTIDEVAFYGAALSDARIAAHYAAGTASAGVTVSGEAFTSAATALDGALLLPVSVAGEAFASAATALDGTAVVAEPDPPVIIAGEAFFSTGAALDGIIPDLPTGTDTSNAAGGRIREGVGVMTLTPPVAPVPPGITRGHRYDKAVALPTPTLVNGRPT